MTTNNLEIKLRRKEVAGLENFFKFQLDKEASYLAAFTPNDPADKSAYLITHSKLLSDPTN